MRLLVTGGAGFIGSHMVDLLVNRGHEVIVLDSLEKGHRDAVHEKATFYQGDIADKSLLTTLFNTHAIDAVFHFAAYIEVGESVAKPEKYLENNYQKPLVLLDTMLTHQVKKFIFSSTAAVYGEPDYTPIDLTHPCHPVNPYGEAKRQLELALVGYANTHELASVSLRYFNAAGAHPDGHLGERHDPETHLIPIALEVIQGKRESLAIYGDDYPTPDGSCVRDYIHVMDLCDAHLLALDKLSVPKALTYNLGNGVGYSVKEVIRVVAEVTGKTLSTKTSTRRLGDPAILVADASAAYKELAWQPRYHDLKTIIDHAWQFLNKE